VTALPGSPDQPMSGPSDDTVADPASPQTAAPLRPGTALITGAARRVGAAIAEDLAARGWRVAVHYRGSADDAEAVVGRITSAGGTALALQADLAREAETTTLVGRAAAALGPVTLLVNNASTFEPDDPLEIDRAGWDAHLEANLRAPLVLSQALAAARPPDSPALIVNMLDQRVLRPTPAFLAYTVSKSALWTLTQTLALALAPWVRVVAIGPGPTLPSPRQTPEDFRRQCQGLPLARGTTPAEICAAIHFLMDTPSITGQMIALDGGQHLGWAHPVEPPPHSE